MEWPLITDKEINLITTLLGINLNYIDFIQYYKLAQLRVKDFHDIYKLIPIKYRIDLTYDHLDVFKCKNKGYVVVSKYMYFLCVKVLRYYRQSLTW